MGSDRVEHNLGQEIAARLEDAKYGHRGEIVSQYCEVLGWSESKLYSVAAEFGYSSGRAPRRDKGRYRKADPDKMALIGALVNHTRRKTGKVNLATWNAVEMLQDSGVITSDESPSESTVNRHLRELHMSRADMGRPQATRRMRSLHPNHVHQIDASICVMWDFKDKKHLVGRDMEKEFYKNKPGFWKKVKKVIIRYICTDHTTGWFYVRYYYSQGEDFSNLFDFTMRAWGAKENPAIFPAHGVPRILMIDKGAANVSQLYTNLMKNLTVETYIHTPGKPWINGTVETNHGFWERTFEGQLSFLDIEDIDELNARAADMCAYINATRTHGRTGMTRFEGFSAIGKEQLRILMPREICRELCYRDSVQVTVNGFNEVHHGGKRYNLGSTFSRGDKLWLRYNLDEYPAIRLNTQENFEGESVASTLINDDAWHYPVDAPVINEGYKSHKKSAIDRAKDTIKGIDISGIKPQLKAPKLAGMTWMRKAGTDLAPPSPVIIPPMTAHEARKRLRDELSIDRFTPEQSEWLDARLVGSVTDEQYTAVRDEYSEQFIEAPVPVEVTPAARRLGLA